MKIRKIKAIENDRDYSNYDDTHVFENQSEIKIHLSNKILSALMKNENLIEPFCEELNNIKDDIRKNGVPLDKNYNITLKYKGANGEPKNLNKNFVLLAINSNNAYLDVPSIDYASKAPMKIDEQISKLTDVNENISHEFIDKMYGLYNAKDEDENRIEGDFTEEDSEEAWDLVKANLDVLSDKIIDKIYSAVKDTEVKKKEEVTLEGKNNLREPEEGNESIEEESIEEVGTDRLQNFVNKFKNDKTLIEYIMKQFYADPRGKAVYEFMINEFPLETASGDFQRGLGVPLTKDIVFNYIKSKPNTKNIIEHLDKTISANKENIKKQKLFQEKYGDKAKKVINDLYKMNTPWSNNIQNELDNRLNVVTDKQNLQSYKSEIFKKISMDDFKGIYNSLIDDVFSQFDYNIEDKSEEEKQALKKAVYPYLNIYNSLLELFKANGESFVPFKFESSLNGPEEEKDEKELVLEDLGEEYIDENVSEEEGDGNEQ